MEVIDFYYDVIPFVSFHFVLDYELMVNGVRTRTLTSVNRDLSSHMFSPFIFVESSMLVNLVNLFDGKTVFRLRVSVTFSTTSSCSIGSFNLYVRVFSWTTVMESCSIILVCIDSALLKYVSL